MRKTLILLAIIISLPYVSFCQSISRKNSVAISVGPSIPFGNYSKTDAENLLSGYAKTGTIFKLTYDFKLTPTWGLEIMINEQKNRLNTHAFEQQLNGTHFFNDTRTYSNWSVHPKRWFTRSLLVGVTGEFPLKSSGPISLTAKALAGKAIAVAPDLEANSKMDTSYATFSGKYGSATGPSFLISAGIKYKLNTRFRVFLEGGYFGTATLSFKEVTQAILATDGGLMIPGLYNFQNSVNPPISMGQIGSRKQAIQSLILNVGIEWVW